LGRWGGLIVGIACISQAGNEQNEHAVDLIKAIGKDVEIGIVSESQAASDLVWNCSSLTEPRETCSE